MPMTLTWRAATTLLVKAEGLTPAALAPLSTADAARRPVRIGNASAVLGDLFAIQGDGTDGEIILEGDLRHVARIGAGMSSGKLTIRGDAGPDLGAAMTGGRIEVAGSVGDRAGAELRGGMIHVRGDAGHSLGAAYPGSPVGMREGTILVEGKAGDDVGLALRRGLIAIAGGAGDRLGRNLVAGSILVFGTVGASPGAGMKRGTLALFGPSNPEGPGLLTTFPPAGLFQLPFLALYLRRLREWGFPVPAEAFSGPVSRYNGDLAVGGQGEILVGTGLHR